MEPIEVVRTFLRAWVDNDVPTAMTFIAPDARYILYISNDLLPFGGETAGRDNIERVLRQIRVDYEYLLFRPYNFKVDGDVVRLRVEFMYRHVASGEVLSGRFRLIMRLRDGLIVQADEYHDRALVEAFLRLHVAPRRPET